MGGMRFDLTLSGQERPSDRSVAQSLPTTLSRSSRFLSRPFVPTGRLTSIDVQAKANIKLTESVEASGPPNDLAELPQGERVLGGVKFTIGNSLIQLDGTHLPEKLRKQKGRRSRR